MVVVDRDAVLDALEDNVYANRQNLSTRPYVVADGDDDVVEGEIDTREISDAQDGSEELVVRVTRLVDWSRVSGSYPRRDVVWCEVEMETDGLPSDDEVDRELKRRIDEWRAEIREALAETVTSDGREFEITFDADDSL
ncbi:hypothetical protein C475_08977 [Halosimplex carlsbadense 2-9-1]|uniref:Uncharacterized protein n=1 Tax=Halosimplex carlsbadense 2-9-1 TaxID=797114 RepID=M0CVV6_9EURY|nr:hypothetical protein [Halosimplex carlsbadense]ELZ26547.1 hypothetical protein C475_08977 [Halosimplex carlsbadense 2-9-1]